MAGIRLLDLKQRLGLNNRIVSSWQEIRDNNTAIDTLDYTDIQRQLQTLATTSWNYLHTSLMSIKHE